MDVIDGVLACDEAIKIVFHEGFQLACPLTSFHLQILSAFDQLCKRGALQQVTPAASQPLSAHAYQLFLIADSSRQSLESI